MNVHLHRSSRPRTLRLGLALGLALLSAGCPEDAGEPAGTLRLLQAQGRIGEEKDGLGALVVGQAVCGTHVFVRAEGGQVSFLGEARVARACLALPGHGDQRTLELGAYPGHTTMVLHASLLLDPRACAAPSELCRATCRGSDAPEKPGDPPPAVQSTCPEGWFVLDQTTLSVLAALPNAEPATGTSGGGASTGATGSSGETTTTQGTTDTSGSSSG